jgi:hypothetical protein
LDPWLVSGVYAGGLWVSPPTFGPAAQSGTTFTLKARAQGINAAGTPAPISPDWISSDPDMLTVSPAQGHQVTITVWRAGQSTLTVAFGGFSKDLFVHALNRDNAILVEIK